jgi:hypothetical protein
MLPLRSHRFLPRLAAWLAVALCCAHPCRALGTADRPPATLGVPYELGPLPALAAEPGSEGEGADSTATDVQDGDGVAQPGADASAARWHLFWAGFIAAGVVGGTTYNSLTDGDLQPYHFAHEGWFGEGTYVGGADKASHFVSFEIIAKELATAYEYLGFSRKQSILGGVAVSSLAGLANEICDGANKYGFSYEDLTMDVLGAGTAALIAATDSDDLVGFRFGPLPGPAPPRETDGIGRDYSHEIYTADLKLVGLSRRLGFDTRPARFLLTSVTYGTQGYPYGATDQRERLVGFELGLNFGEMLYALHVTQETWWGIAAHLVLDNLRIPYTQIGFRYDVNHGHWYGPGVGGTT